jgi:hypothetical protein
MCGRIEDGLVGGELNPHDHALAPLFLSAMKLRVINLQVTSLRRSSLPPRRFMPRFEQVRRGGRGHGAARQWEGHD